MTLLDDEARCANYACPLRDNCLRWIETTSGRSWAWFEPSGDFCEHQIKPEEPTND